jgi:hypothetical protein
MNGTERHVSSNGDWAFANLGVLLALALAFVATLVGTRAAVRAQETAA